MTLLGAPTSLPDRWQQRSSRRALIGLAGAGVVMGVVMGLAIGLASPVMAQAVPTHGMGLDISAPEEFGDAPVAPITRGFLPEAVDLSPWFPTPGDQGEIGSCVSWALGYGIRSYYEIVQLRGVKAGPQSIASPADLHLQMRRQFGGSCSAPNSNISRGLILLQNNGVATVADYPPDSDESFCRPSPVAAHRLKAKGLLRASDRDFRYGKGVWSSGLARSSLERMKQLLSEGHPIAIGLLVGPLFGSHRGDTVFKTSVYSEKDLSPKKVGGHALAIVGYDDRRHAFRILNSWGETWGDGGYIWVDYDIILSDARDAFAIAPDGPPPPRPPAGSGATPSDAPPLRCSALTATGSKLSGFVATVDDLKAVGEYARGKDFEADVALQPWPVCEALLTLNAPLKMQDGPKVALVGGERVLKVGETFAISVTPPRLPSYLYVVYVEDDGTVVNLSPRRGPIRRQTDGGAAPLLFGDGAQGRPTFRVTPLKSSEVDGRPRASAERGHEMVVVVAARAPIAELEAAEGPDSPFYRAAPKAGAPAAAAPDRLFLSALRDISLQRAAPDTLPREVMAAVLHLKIAD